MVAVIVALLLFATPPAAASATSASDSCATAAPAPPPEGDCSATSQPATEEPAAETEPDEQDPLQRDYLTGNWGGVRDKLEEHGLTVQLDWIGLGLVNAHGGLRTRKATEYTNLTQLSLTFDTGAAKLWEGGEFYVLGEDCHGRGISERDVGDLLGVNTYEAPSFTQVSEYWWRQTLLDDKLWFKLGKIDANADLAFAKYGLEFINGAMSANAAVPLPTYPDPALGAEVGLEPTDWIYFAGGVFDQDGQGDRWGFDTAFHGTDDSVSVAEMGLKPAFRIAGRKLPGIYRVGGWYSSGNEDVIFDDLGGRLRPRIHRGNSGTYLDFDQLVWKENDREEDEQGLGLFFQFGWAPQEYNEISHFYCGGLQWTGLVPTRDQDIFGFGLAHASLSGRIQQLEARYNETAIEAFYKVYVTPWLSIQPDVQYIVDPGGAGRDSLVTGLRVQISF